MLSVLLVNMNITRSQDRVKTSFHELFKRQRVGDLLKTITNTRGTATELTRSNVLSLGSSDEQVSEENR